MPNVQFKVTIMCNDGTKIVKEMMGSAVERLICNDAPNDGRIKFVAVTRGNKYVCDWIASR